MMAVFYIIMVLSISVVLHPFPHLMPWKRLLTYYIYNDPIIHAAIPNGSQKERSFDLSFLLSSNCELPAVGDLIA